MNETRIRFFAVLAVIWWVTCPTVGLGDDFLRRSGQHITLTTDLDAPHADELIAAFDAAVPQWSQFWQLPPGALDDWKVDACVMRDRAAFHNAGLIPRGVPNFPFGYALGNRLWVVAQQGEYYTRHLLLHEGVHALAFDQFGGAGPSWFMEGTAELLSVHTGSGSETKINRVPKNRESVPFWGRFKLMSERRAASGIPALETVLGYPRELKSDVESYGWSWAATMLLNHYPEYNEALQKSARSGRSNDASFNVQLKQQLGDQWPVVTARWQLMCHELDYGFDWSRERVALSMDDRIWDGSPLSIKIAADQGWQSIGVRLAPGTKVKVIPTGRCTLANDPKPWVSEPTGVTIRYHNGRPLGQLLACLVANAPANVATLKPLKVAPITKASAINIQENCWMLFRVNDAVGELGDNTGSYTVRISK